MKNKEASEREGGRVDQIFSFRMVVEKIIAKGKKYTLPSWLALWEVLKLYGVGGKLLSAIKSFYEEASAC